MSAHRRRNRNEETNSQTNGLNLNGIDLNSVAAIMKNIDINQLTSIIGSLNQSQGNYNENNNIDDSEEAVRDRRQRRREIVNALTTLMNADRAELLQVVMQLYGTKKTENR